MTELFVANIDSLKNKELFQAFYHTLPAFRKEKVDRLQNEDKKRSSLGAWVLLSHVLKNHGIAPDTASFSYTQNGKPFLKSHPDMHFSLSHSGSQVLCVLSGAPVGCDTERIRPVESSLANRVFTAAEQAQLAKADDKQKMFFRLWTLKESVIKATGENLLMLKDFSVIIKDDGITLDPNKTFSLKEFSLNDDYCYACCFSTPEISDPIIVNLENI